MEINAGSHTFVFSLTGPDKQFEPALRLLAHFLQSAKGDDEALSDAKDEDKVDRKSFGKQKDDVLTPMREYVMYGSKSTYLNQLSKSEIKALKNEDLLSLFREVQQYDCELLYCGTKTISEVAAAAQQALPLSNCTRKEADTFRPLQQYTEPMVYFYNVPKSRQNYVISFDAISPLSTADDRAKLSLFGEYFGGSMSSVLFQNVREFRSLVYSTGGRAYATSLAQHPDAVLGLHKRFDVGDLLGPRPLDLRTDDVDVRYDPYKLPVVIDHGKVPQSVPEEYAGGVVDGHARIAADGARFHDLTDGLVLPVAVLQQFLGRHETEEVSALGYGEAVEVGVDHLVDDLPDGHVRSDGDHFLDHVLRYCWRSHCRTLAGVVASVYMVMLDFRRRPLGSAVPNLPNGRNLKRYIPAPHTPQYCPGSVVAYHEALSRLRLGFKFRPGRFSVPNSRTTSCQA